MTESTKSLLEVLDKLVALPPVCPDESSQYTVKGCQVESVIKASSAFEAATKFSYCLREVSRLRPNEAITVEITDLEKDSYVYDITIADDKPVVELCYLVKNKPLALSNSESDTDQGASRDNGVEEATTSIPESS